MEGRILLQHAERYILGGRAEVMFYNSKTGNREWYFIKEKGANWYFVFSRGEKIPLGTISFREFKFNLQFNQMVPTLFEKVYKRPLKVFSWVWRHITKLSLPDEIHIYHQGSCSVCGRALLDPESIKIGIGPKCLKRLQDEHKSNS